VERGIQWVVWGPSFRNQDGTAKYWERNQPRLNLSFPSGAAVVEVIPESAKLNINTATPDDLYRVALAVTGDEGRAHQIAEGIVDWRGPGDGAGAFDQYYFSIRPTFHARHASFQEIEELLLVRGMTPEYFYGNYSADADGRLYARGGLRDCLSPWGSMGAFDVNTVSPALMEAVGVSPGDIANIVTLREKNPFRTQADVLKLTPYVTRLTVGGGRSIFTLRATARLRRSDGMFSDVVRTAAATVKIMDTRQSPLPAVVLRWYEDAWSQDIVPPMNPTTVSSGGFLPLPLPGATTGAGDNAEARQ
jgi:general secretion pathway protein K